MILTRRTASRGTVVHRGDPGSRSAGFGARAFGGPRPRPWPPARRVVLSACLVMAGLAPIACDDALTWPDGSGGTDVKMATVMPAQLNPIKDVAPAPAPPLRLIVSVAPITGDFAQSYHMTSRAKSPVDIDSLRVQMRRLAQTQFATALVEYLSQRRLFQHVIQGSARGEGLADLVLECRLGQYQVAQQTAMNVVGTSVSQRAVATASLRGEFTLRGGSGDRWDFTVEKVSPQQVLAGDVMGVQNQMGTYFTSATKEFLALVGAEIEKVRPQLALLADKKPAPPVAGAPKPARPKPVADRWAVVIGVSEHKHPDAKRLPNLKYAHRDAEELAKFLRSPAGGRFAADHVRVLTNKQATGRGIREALFEFLKRSVKEDLVVVFFSGHGLPDPDKPSNLYLMAHDSDPSKIASTGVPMWDIETALKRTIAAERVVVLVDACHSAGATEGVGGVKGVRIGDQFNKYFEQLAQAKPGRVIFTSSEGYEVSRESRKWGGGHGVFTWALLEALKGKADRDKNGIVTLGEVLDYVDITVRRETANEQHPTKAGVRFDRNLPMGVVK